MPAYNSAAGMTSHMASPDAVSTNCASARMPMILARQSRFRAETLAQQTRLRELYPVLIVQETRVNVGYLARLFRSQLQQPTRWRRVVGDHPDPAVRQHI